MQQVNGFSSYQNTVNQAGSGSSGTGAVGLSGQISSSQAGSVRADLSALPKGTVFQGVVTQVRDGQVLLQLEQGQSVQARLESGVQIRPGEPLFFQVTSNENDQILLRQLPVSSQYNPTFQNALSVAGLPMTERNLQMVNQMMQEQMPIDRDSLGNMARMLLRFPNQTPETLVQIQKLGFPTDPEMVQQFADYKAGTHSLVARFDQLMEQLPPLLGQQDASVEQLLGLQDHLFQVLELTGQEAQTGLLEGLQGAQPEQGLPVGTEITQMGQTPQIAENSTQAGEMMQAGAEVLQSESALQVGQALREAGTDMLQAGQAFQETGAETLQSGQVIREVGAEPSLAEQVLQAGEAVTQAAESNPQTQSTGSLPIDQFLTQDTQAQLEQQLGELPGLQEDPAIFQDGKLLTNMTARELLQALAQHLTSAGAAQENSAREIKQLLAGDGYRELLKQAMSEQWLLTPEQVASKENVQQLYERMDRQMQKLQQLLQQTPGEHQALQRVTTQVQSNVEMMNQINQLYNYVQIPLKLQNQNAHSDLYVYTNKRKLQDKDGELSALLHLELEHLGTTDVQIKMLGQKVTTHFYLEDEQSFDLVEQHLDELTQRLEQKGYQCTMQVENRQQKQDFVRDFLEQENPVGQLARYSFDVKA